jgi:hypothetical protein
MREVPTLDHGRHEGALVDRCREAVGIVSARLIAAAIAIVPAERIRRQQLGGLVRLEHESHLHRRQSPPSDSNRKPLHHKYLSQPDKPDQEGV